jgi:DNA (cytosine-5)-methyltransferase 1
MTLTHGSLFSGVGGFDLGADAAGIKTLWQCEIDKKATSVLKRHWPDVKRYGNVTEVKGDAIDPVDIISFGSPCQDLSVAGKGAGLAGTRSGLFHEAIRIVREMLSATNNQYPRFVIWENVRGALSSNQGKDFHTVLTEMANLGAVDISYRLTNACQFGVPQRRVRVFVVADLAGQCAGEILAQPPRLLWHPPKVGGKGKGTSGKAQKSTKHGGGVTTFVKAKRASNADDYETWKDTPVSPTLNIFDNAGEIRATVLAITERAGKPGGGKGILLTNELSPTLRAAGIQTIAEPEVLAVDGYNQKTDDKLYHSLRTGIDSGDSIVEYDYRIRRLTPTECERLQGWPDDHTRYDSEGNELSDSARYKMIGNGIATPVAQWLCENLVAAVEAESNTPGTHNPR